MIYIISLYLSLCFNSGEPVSYEEFIIRSIQSNSFDRLNESYKKEEELAILIRLDVWNENLDRYDHFRSELDKIENRNSSKFIDAAFCLARLVHLKGRYRLADSIYTSAINPINSLSGILHSIEYADNLISLDRYYKADSTFNELMKSQNFKNNEFQILKAYLLEKRGLTKVYLSDFDKADSCFVAAQEIWKDNEGTQNHPWNLELQNHQSILWTKKGEYDKAEEILLSLKEAVCAQEGELICADVHSNLGSLYRLLANYKEAEGYYKKAQKLYSTQGNLTEYVLTKSNLALNYDNQYNIKKALQLYQEVVDIYENDITQKDLKYAIALNNYAGLLEYEENLEKSEKLYQRSLGIIKDNLGEESDFYVTVLSNVGILNEYLEDYNVSIEAYKKGLEIRKKVVGERHPKYVELLYNLAGVYIHLDQEESAKQYYRANALNLDLINYYYSTFDQETRINYLDKMRIELERFYSLAAQNSENAQLVNHAFQLSYQLKGLALEYHVGIEDAKLRDEGSAYKKWKIIRDSIAQLITQPINENEKKEIDLEAMIAEARQLERNISRNRDSKKPHEFSSEAFGLNECVVDFINFEMFENGYWTDTTHYYALIHDPVKGKTSMVSISDEYALNDGLSTIKRSTDESSFYELIEKVWRPIAPLIESYNQIHVSPSGLLNKVPLAAASPLNYMGWKDKNIKTYSTLRNLSLQKAERQKIKRALLIGGVDFGTPNTEDEFKVSFPGLKGSLLEVSEIHKRIRTKKSKKVILSGLDVTEGSLRGNLSENSYDVIHIATHGFFFNVVDRPELSDGSLRNKLITHPNPMMRSGLILSEANSVWMSPVSTSGLKDNILTSLEISNLSIPSDLVVLSACESGLGDLHNEEGVMGLQRAFKMAGVDKLIMSLWKVPDQETSELMILFYENLMKHKNIHTAFKNTQLAMAEKYAPFYWAGFVLVE